MTLSTYVINELSNIKQSSKYDHYDVSQKLKEASKKATCEQDSHNLDILSGVLSMCYNKKEHKFHPMIVSYVEGKRSFSIEDISQENIALLESAAKNTDNIHLRTRLFHVA